MKNTFYQIDLLRFKILFDIRLKKTSPFFIHCSFKCSILSTSIFEYLVSFLTDKIKFRIFFLAGINLFPWASFNSQSTKYIFFSKIRNSTLNIFGCFTSFSYLKPDVIYNPFIYRLNDTCCFSSIMKLMSFLIKKNNSILQCS